MITRNRIEQIYRDILKGLEPTFASRVAAWRDAVIEQGVIPYVYCGRRTPAEQEKLYAQGRSEPGKIVTQARGKPVPQSFHCYGRAIDWVPAKPIKADSYEADWDNVQQYGVGIETGKSFNLQALSWERPHLQDGYYKDWRDLAMATTDAPKSEPVTDNRNSKTKIKLRTTR